MSLYSWFKISELDPTTEKNAWLLVQHADDYPEVQKKVLRQLEKLYKMGESNPHNYAYLFDRIAVSFKDPTLRKPQRYGTQGSCVGPGQWETFPMEDPENVDLRRKEVGLGSLQEYWNGFKSICR